MDRARLAHHLVVDVQPPGGVEDHEVDEAAASLGDRSAGDLHRSALSGLEERGVDLGRKHPELLDGRGAIDVAAREQGLAPVPLAKPSGELRAGGSLARALQPRDEERGGGRNVQGEAAMLSRHQPHELVVHDADEGLARRQALQHLLPDRAGADPVEELAGDGQRDVRFEQGAPDLAQRVADVLLAQASAAAELSEGAGEPLADGFEHAMILTRQPPTRER